MIKIWTNPDKGDDKIIAIVDDMIYKCNPAPEEVDAVASGLQVKSIPQKNIFGIPFHYLHEFRYQEGKNYIQVFFREGSEEHLRINNPERLQEVFECFKTLLPSSKYYIDRYKPFRAGKKPLIALAVVSILFIWTLFIAFGIQDGNEYDVKGGRYYSWAGIVLMFAAMGVRNVILIYGSLIVIAILSFIKKFKNPPVIHRVLVSRS